MKVNTNYLAGMVCPSCDSFGPFQIAISCWASVDDDGVGDTEAFDWDDDSGCRCEACGHNDCVKVFRLDESRILRRVSGLIKDVLGSLTDGEPRYSDKEREALSESLDWLAHMGEWYMHQDEKRSRG